MIDDFQNGVDKIDLNGFGFKGNFAALMSHAHQEGSSVIFKFDNGEQIKFLNTDIGMFDKGDFF